MTEPLSPEREAEIRETHPGAWYDGPWTQDYVDSDGADPAYCRVVHHRSGTVLATLPDFAGGIALFIADAHDAVPELLAEVDRLRSELGYAEEQHEELRRDAECAKRLLAQHLGGSLNQDGALAGLARLRAELAAPEADAAEAGGRS